MTPVELVKIKHLWRFWFWKEEQRAQIFISENSFGSSEINEDSFLWKILGLS